MSYLLPLHLSSNQDFSRDGEEARSFCLRIIKDFYGIEYNPIWHADLDSLLSEGANNWFTSASRGALFVVRNDDGAIVGTGGLYPLDRKPGTAGRVANRYPVAAKTCQVARVYLDEGARGRGLGKGIVAGLEIQARHLGYTTSYLHADAKTTNTLSFWSSRGYREFGRFSYPSGNRTDTSVDFDKHLEP